MDEILPTPRTVRHGPPLASEHVPGDVYRMPAGIFHRSRVTQDRPTLTAVFGSGVPGSRDLSLGRLTAAPHRVTRLRCSPGETMRLARLAADLLTEARPRLR